MYSVNLWGSHPDDDNDDCWTGLEFATVEEAKECAANWREHFPLEVDADVAYIEIHGGFGSELIKNPRHKRAKHIENGEWKREAAMQAGMAFGCAGYNDEYGY